VDAMESERRAAPRAQRRFWVLVEGEIGFTADVTANGFCVEGMRVAPPGASVSGSIAVGGREFEFTGMVCWARAIDAHSSRTGIRFLEVPDEFKSVFNGSEARH